MSSTVSVGGFEITSTDTPASEMVDALTSPKEDAASPKVLVDEGKPVKAEDAELSKAAAELGRKGGEATAEKRKTAPIKDKPKEEAKEGAKPAEEEDEGEKARRELSEEIEKAPPEQKRKLASDRVAEATRDAAAAKRALAAERIEKERLARELREARTQAPPRPAAAPAAAPAAQAQDDPEPVNKPVPSQFDDWNVYEDARDKWVDEHARWAARQEYRAEQERARVEEARTEREHKITSAMESFHDRIGKAAEADPDFLDRTLPFLEGLRPSFMVPREELGAKNLIADELLKSESAPALVAYFVENPDAFQRIAALQTSRDVLREMAKVEAKVESRSEAATAGNPAPKQEVSKANPPLRPVKGAPPAAEPDLYGEMDFDTFAKRARARR